MEQKDASNDERKSLNIKYHQIGGVPQIKEQNPYKVQR